MRNQLCAAFAAFTVLTAGAAAQLTPLVDLYQRFNYGLTIGTNVSATNGPGTLRWDPEAERPSFHDGSEWHLLDAADGSVPFGTGTNQVPRGSWFLAVSNALEGFALSSALLDYLPSAQAATQYLSVAAAASAYQPLGAYGTNSTTAFRGDWGASVSNLAAQAAGWGDHAAAGYLTAESDTVALAAVAGVQSNLTAHAADTDNPHGVTAEQIGALTEESDPVWAAASGSVVYATTPGYTAAVEQAAAAFGWGDHGEAGYLTAETDAAALSAVAAVSGRVDVVESWGDHAEAGYLTEEADAAALSAVAAVSGRVDVVEGWGDHAEAGYALSSTLLGYLPSAQAATQYLSVTSAAADYLPLAGHNGPVVLGTSIRGFGATTNVGSYGFAAGVDTSAGSYGFAAGVDTSAGNYGFAAGSGTSAGYAGFAAGEGTSAGNAGFAAGWNTSAGEGGFAAGFDTSAGEGGFAAGSSTSAGEGGFAAGAGTSAGDFGFAAGLGAKGADGSFIFADNSGGGATFNRTNRPNEFSARAAGGVYFDTPMMAVTGTVSAGSITLGTNAPITNWPEGGTGTGISAAEAGQIATNVLSTATTNDMPGIDWGSLGGGGTADPFSSILVEADWTWTNNIYAVGANTSATNIAITLPDAGTNFASVVVRKFSNLNQLRVVRGTNVVYTLYDDGSTRSYDWWPQYTNWYWRN